VDRNDTEPNDLPGTGLVKVRVKFEQEDGWPPFTSEGLWAAPLPAGTFELRNTPFFAFGLSISDEISAREAADGQLWFTERVERGGRLTVRIIASHETDTNAVILDEFSRLSVSGEGMSSPRLVALDIGPESDWTSAKALLVAGLESGRWHYEESDITPDWESV
jgi:hypothetical protein